VVESGFGEMAVEYAAIVLSAHGIVHVHTHLHRYTHTHRVHTRTSHSLHY
jgi:hypothetical protein